MLICMSLLSLTRAFAGYKVTLRNTDNLLIGCIVQAPPPPLPNSDLVNNYAK